MIISRIKTEIIRILILYIYIYVCFKIPLMDKEGKELHAC